MKHLRPPTLLLLPLFLLALSLHSCSCQQRLEHLMRHCPECFQQDTVTHNDTLLPPPIPLFGHLSWYQLNQPGPVALHGANYTLDISLDDSGLTIDGTVNPDTIFRTIRVPVDRPVIVKQPPKTSLPAWAVFILLALFALWGTFSSLNNLRK